MPPTPISASVHGSPLAFFTVRRTIDPICRAAFLAEKLTAVGVLDRNPGSVWRATLGGDLRAANPTPVGICVGRLSSGHESGKQVP